MTAGADGELRVYAPHGYDDLFALVVRPNRRLAPRHVYEAKAARWAQAVAGAHRPALGRRRRP